MVLAKGGEVMRKLIALAVALSTLVVLNLVISNLHLRTILDSVEVTENVMVDYKRQTKLSRSENVGCIRSEVSGREYCGTEINEWVTDTVKPSARASRIDLEVASFRLERINTIFFGLEFETVVNEYLSHTEAWLDYLERLESCNDWKCFYTEEVRPNAISATFRVSEIEFLSAIPIIDIFQSKKRVDKIFEI